MTKKRLVKIVASALVCDEGRVLILKRARDFEEVHRGKGLWEPPGGGIEPNEQVEKSLRRELREETGLTISREPVLVATCSYVLADETISVRRLHYVYAVHLRRRTTIRLSEEHVTGRWVRTPKELARLEMIPRMRTCLLYTSPSPRDS